MVDYAQSLRSIGQALELLAAEDFELEIDGEAFLVRCKLPRPKPKVSGEPDQETLLQHVWGVLPRDSTLEINLTVAHWSSADAMNTDLSYSLRDVERLDGEGKAKRSDHPETARPGLSQFLRTVGAYVNQKPARLLRISRRYESISVAYEAPSGQRNEEVFSGAALYDMWVRMAMKRRDRA